jgi:hypothetical protein
MASAALALGLAGWSHRAAAQVADGTCDIRTTERIVAVADVHGAYDRFVAILRTAGLIDERRRWSGGRAIFVQMGDVVDRGPDSRRALELLRRLEGEAMRAGGRVHALLGNHEVMRMRGDFRYTTLAEFASFRSTRFDGGEPDRGRGGALGPLLEETLPGVADMRLAFGPDGEYGRWLLTHDTMIKINGTVFVHGGISASVAALGCAAINSTVRAELKTLPADRGLPPSLIGENGPLWYRGLALEDEAVVEADLQATLRHLGARIIVLAHTPVETGRVGYRFGGRVIHLDTGMLGGSSFPRGRASALEIDGATFTAIYEDRRDVLLRVVPAD